MRKKISAWGFAIVVLAILVLPLVAYAANLYTDDYSHTSPPDSINLNVYDTGWADPGQLFTIFHTNDFVQASNGTGGATFPGINDASVAVQYTYKSRNNVGGVLVRNADSGINNGIRCGMEALTDTVSITEFVGGVPTVIDSAAFDSTSNVFYNMVCSVDDADVVELWVGGVMLASGSTVVSTGFDAFGFFTSGDFVAFDDVSVDGDPDFYDPPPPATNTPLPPTPTNTAVPPTPTSTPVSPPLDLGVDLSDVVGFAADTVGPVAPVVAGSIGLGLAFRVISKFIR